MPPIKTEPKLDKVDTQEPAWVKAIIESNNATQKALADLAKIVSQQPQQQQVQVPSTRNVADPDDKEDIIDPNVLETLPRAQFMALMEGRMSKRIQKEVLAPMTERLDQLNKGLTSTQIEKMLQEAMGKHPDLLEYQESMMKLAQVHKTLTPEQLYKMAKDETPPETVAAITAKYTKPTDDKKPATFTFGGLMPSNGGSEERNSRMDAPTAAEDAWAKTVAEMGGEPAFSE